VTNRFALAGREIGAGRTFIIGEVAQAHDGSLDAAHAYVDAIADAGADAVKFQTHIASAESTASEPFRVRLATADKTRFDYWKRMEFAAEAWRALADHARMRGLVFLSSPFSPEAVDLLLGVGVPAWKIASGTLNDEPTLSRMLATGLPLLISTGMSGWEEIDRSVARARSAAVPYLLFQTTSAYPCPPERIGLNVLEELRRRGGCPVGLSDHSGTIVPALAAATLGADAVEVHVCMSRDSSGPDVPASVTAGELASLVAGVRMIDTIRAHPVDKDRAAADAAPLRTIFGKRIVARVPLAAGTVLRVEHLAAKKPGDGLPPDHMPALVGRRLTRAIAADDPIRLEDLAVEGPVA
jgi:N-acetylneuraminate synthase